MKCGSHLKTTWNGTFDLKLQVFDLHDPVDLGFWDAPSWFQHAKSDWCNSTQARRIIQCQTPMSNCCTKPRSMSDMIPSFLNTKMVQEKQRTREISHVENLRLDSFGRLMVRWFGRLAWLAVSERSERADKQTGKVNSFVSSERRGWDGDRIRTSASKVLRLLRPGSLVFFKPRLKSYEDDRWDSSQSGVERWVFCSNSAELMRSFSFFSVFSVFSVFSFISGICGNVLTRSTSECSRLSQVVTWRCGRWKQRRWRRAGDVGVCVTPSKVGFALGISALETSVASWSWESQTQGTVALRISWYLMSSWPTPVL